MFSSLYTCARDTGAGGRAHTQARTRAHACSSSGESSRNSRNSRRPAATASGALQTGGRELVSRGHALFAAERCNVGTMLRRGRSVFPTVCALAVAISRLAFTTCALVSMRIDGTAARRTEAGRLACASPTPRGTTLHCTKRGERLAHGYRRRTGPCNWRSRTWAWRRESSSLEHFDVGSPRSSPRSSPCASPPSSPRPSSSPGPATTPGAAGPSCCRLHRSRRHLEFGRARCRARRSVLGLSQPRRLPAYEIVRRAIWRT